MSSSNPVFNEKTLSKIEKVSEADQRMTIHGSINKTGILLLLTILSSAFAWNIAETPVGAMLSVASMLVNLVLCLVLVFNKPLSKSLAPAYALIEGLSLGFISYWSNKSMPGVVENAMILTFSTVALMLGLYHYRVIRVTERFKSIVIAGTLAVCFTYIADLAMSFFGSSIPMIHQGTYMGIGFSLLVTGLAASNLLLDFDMIEKSVQANAPKWMEWYAGFAVLVTVVWLYIEMLRLLSKLSRR